MDSIDVRCCLKPSNVSRFHTLLEQRYVPVYRNDQAELDLGRDSIAELVNQVKIFVLQNDWLKIIPDGKGLVETPDLRLPFEHCAFEAAVEAALPTDDKRIEGFPHKTISFNMITLWSQLAEDSNRIKRIVFVRYAAQPVWVLLPADILNDEYTVRFVDSQICAALIALDSGIGIRETKPASLRLNVKRKRNGKPPVRDFSVVHLNRQRASPMSYPSNGSARNSPRLHFRRGHWREYETHKVWINWMLVGNPDLGFIEQEYRL